MECFGCGWSFTNTRASPALSFTSQVQERDFSVKVTRIVNESWHTVSTLHSSETRAQQSHCRGTEWLVLSITVSRRRVSDNLRTQIGDFWKFRLIPAVESGICWTTSTPLRSFRRQTCSSNASCQARSFTLAMKIVFENFPTRYEFFRSAFVARAKTGRTEQGVLVCFIVMVTKYWSGLEGQRERASGMQAAFPVLVGAPLAAAVPSVLLLLPRFSRMHFTHDPFFGDSVLTFYFCVFFLTPSNWLNHRAHTPAHRVIVINV